MLLFLGLGLEEGLEFGVCVLAGLFWGGELGGGLALFYPVYESLDIFLMPVPKLI